MKRTRNGRAAGLIASAATAVALAGGPAAGMAIEVSSILPTSLPSPAASASEVIDIPDASSSGAVPVDGVTGTVEDAAGVAKDAVGSVGNTANKLVGGGSPTPKQSSDGKEDSPDETDGPGRNSSDEPGRVPDGTKAPVDRSSGRTGLGARAAGDPTRESIGAYVASASRAAAGAAHRILDLTGPFGAPLALTILILMAFLAVGTGRDTLVRVENLTHKRVYRL